MNRTHKFMLNSLVSAVNQLVIMIVGFITPRILVNTYGSELNGLVSSLSQFISYMTLVEAGLSGAVVFSLYKPLAERDKGAVGSIISAARKSYTQAGYLFSSGILALAVVYAALKNSAALPFRLIFCLTLILGVNGCLDFFILSGYKVLFTADQKIYMTTGVGIMQTVLRTAIICICGYYRLDVILLYLLACVPVALKAAVLLYFGKKHYPDLDKRAKPDRAALRKRWDVIYQQILSTVQTGAPTVLATFLVSLKTVSVYTVYNMVLSGINGVLAIFVSGLPASFGEMIAKGEKETLKRTTSEFEVAYYYILTVVYGITMVMLLPFISLYTASFSDADYYVPSLGIAIVINGLLYNIKTPQSMLILSSGMYRETRWRMSAQGALIIVLGTVLGAEWGLVGIMAGSCISNLYRTVDLVFFVSKRITHCRVRTTAFRMLRVVLGIAAIAAPFLFIPIEVDGYDEWILCAAAVGSYAVAVTTAMTLIFDRTEFCALVRRVKGALFRNNK